MDGGKQWLYCQALQFTPCDEHLGILGDYYDLLHAISQFEYTQ